jgi:hypothetical protein
MSDEHAIARYRHWYRKLLRCYSRPYRERFAESMEQTFNDLCRERAEAGKGLGGFVLWMFIETSAAIIRDNVRLIIMQNKNIIRIALVTACVLLLPLLAGAPWTLSDFVAAGVLLFGTGLAYELISRNGSAIEYRAAVGIACATALLLVWMNLAVGLIGSEDNPANVMYGGVLAVGFLGAITARFQPRGMARTMVATAIAQSLVPMIAMTIWRPPIDSGLVQVLGVNAFFIVLWVASAILFRQAAGPWSKIPGQESGRGASPERVAD